MKSLEKIKMFTNIGKSMIGEVKESESIKESKSNLVKNMIQAKGVEIPKTLAKDLVAVHVARKESIKKMLNSDEAGFIKMAIKESDKVKNASEKLDNMIDMVPEKIKIEYINYKHWCINWFNMSKMFLSAPISVTKGMLKYPWIFDFAKFNPMVTKYVEGRSGANVAQTQKQLTYLGADMCDMIKHALVHPEETAIKHNLVPGELLHAMGIEYFIPESIATVITKTDQFSVARYIDAAESRGVGVDTCGLPKATTGVALKGEIPKGELIVAANLPCDGGLSSYETIQRSLDDAPIYRYNVPYDFRNDESMDEFAEDLKGLVSFLEENTDKKMDWDKLREICTNYNEMVDIELERWELAMLDNPPLSNDCIWFTHYYNFNASKITPELIKHYRELLEMAKKAQKKGIPADKGMRYRTVVWNPPPSAYGHMWNWLERCWGVNAVMDLETYGAMEHIDTSTPDSMLKGLGKRYMWAPMAKHTRGPAENMLGDLRTVITDFKPDFIMYPAHVGCKNSMSLQSEIRDVCKEFDIPCCVFKYELIDNRVTSRQRMRSDISKFMQDIMHAEPLDPSLLEVDDSEMGRW